MAYTPKSGDDGGVFVDDSTNGLSATAWTVAVSIEPQDVTTKNSGGVKENITGLKEYTGSVECTWDSADTINMTGDPAKLQPGTEVKLKLESSSGGDSYTIPKALVSNIETGSPIDGIVPFSFDWVNGLNSKPTGFGETPV